MDRGRNQWDGKVAGRPRQTANGWLGWAGLRDPTFINERGWGGVGGACVYIHVAETGRVVTLVTAAFGVCEDSECPPPPHTHQ